MCNIQVVVALLAAARVYAEAGGGGAFLSESVGVVEPSPMAWAEARAQAAATRQVPASFPQPRSVPHTAAEVEVEAEEEWLRMERMRLELSSVQAGGASLSHENQKLRQELSRWHKVGEKVAVTEAWATNIFLSAKSVVPASASASATVPGVVAASAGNGHASLRGIIAHFQISLLVLTVGIAIWIMLPVSKMKRASKTDAHVHKPSLFESFLRYIGFARYCIELCEIQLAGVPEGCNAALRLRTCRGKDLWMQEAQALQTDASTLRFEEAFVVWVHWYEGPCTLSIVAAGEELAQISIPSRDLVRAAQHGRNLAQTLCLTQTGVDPSLGPAGRSRRKMEKVAGVGHTGCFYATMRINEFALKDLAAGEPWWMRR